MIKGGKGGARTVSGLKFESRVSLKTLFNELPNYEVKDNEVFYKDKFVAELFKKHDLYKRFLSPKKISYLDFISKKMLPDDSILVIEQRTLFIIEVKFQEVAGSVDEKLQTCDFKRKQYEKLLKPLKIKVKYVYILNDWFKKKEYKDVLGYIESVSCYYFFNELPLKFLGLPK
ncbi:hypothetical protein KY330_05375 [Candidatus Woesearchaeota archaeon]|nr:hypothetical protein [Candidatus Woesearchaeota archaeon]